MAFSEELRKRLTIALTDRFVGAELADAADAATAAIAALDPYVVQEVADPGTGAAIPVTRSAVINMTTAAAETNTLAIPTFSGQKLILNLAVFAVGNRVITCAQAINQAGNTIMTFGQVRDNIVLEAIKVGADLRWTVTHNDGVLLS